MQLPAADTKQC